MQQGQPAVTSRGFVNRLSGAEFGCRFHVACSRHGLERGRFYGSRLRTDPSGGKRADNDDDDDDDTNTDRTSVDVQRSAERKEPRSNLQRQPRNGNRHAELSFSKCSSLSLRAYGESGTVGSTSGPSLVVMTSDIAAGPYTYEVSGGRCSFTLTLTAPSG
jgi:hypothetical protein